MVDTQQERGGRAKSAKGLALPAGFTFSRPAGNTLSHCGDLPSLPLMTRAKSLGPGPEHW